MLNTIKYELIKQRTSKIILAGFIILAELAFIIGVCIDNENIWATGTFCLMLLAMITFVIVALEAISTYYRDMQDKSGYMLFMTPHSVYTIMGGKILTGILSIVAATIIFGLLTFADVTVVASKYHELTRMVDSIRAALNQLYAIDISWGDVIIATVDMVFSWIAMITSAFLAITLCMTLIRGVRGKGFISFAAFCAINWFYEFATIQISNWLDLSSYTAQMGFAAVTTVVFAGACFWASGYILKRELSL